MNIKLNELTVKEKLIVMETLWNDLCQNLPDMSSPDWHKCILEEREQMLKEGKDHFIDWDEAKKDILSSIR